MIKFLKVFLILNCISVGLISMIYVLGCFITWNIVPVWTLEDIHPQIIRVAEVCLACVALMLSLEPEVEI